MIVGSCWNNDTRHNLEGLRDTFSREVDTAVYFSPVLELPVIIDVRATTLQETVEVPEELGNLLEKMNGESDEN